MSGLIGKKIGMTSVYSAEGKNIPCTVIEAGPCVVTQIKTLEKDAYEAVQIAYDDKSEKHTSSSLLGHFKKAGTTPKRKMAEFKDMPEVNLGDTLTVDTLLRRGLGGRDRDFERPRLPGRCETSRFRRRRRSDPRPAQPPAQAGFARRLVVSFARIPRQASSGPDGRRAGEGAQPAKY